MALSSASDSAARFLHERVARKYRGAVVRADLADDLDIPLIMRDVVDAGVILGIDEHEGTFAPRIAAMPCSRRARKLASSSLMTASLVPTCQITRSGLPADNLLSSLLTVASIVSPPMPELSTETARPKMAESRV